MSFDIAIVGGGAAGFFCAIAIKELHPNLKVIILEKSDKLLSKVRISGGGRCNVTHNCIENEKLSLNYPRGNTQLQNLFANFNAYDTIIWFENHGVKLKTEPDGRMFPISNSSQTIIDCFLQLARQYGIQIKTKCGVKKIVKLTNEIQLETESEMFICKKIVIATGGYPNIDSYNWIKNLGIEIKPPVPSLFTFNDKNLLYKHLAGLSLHLAKITIQNTDFCQSGPVLFTHWGLSGPAIIKLSAWTAEYLAKQNYIFNVEINFLNEIPTSHAIVNLKEFQTKNGKKNVFANPLFDVPKRLWEMICEQANLSQQRSWAECGNKNIDKVAQLLTKNIFEIKGKTTFKEEFVTCGGVDLEQLNTSKLHLIADANIYFAGEVLNIDGITGGFNFQAAWTTAKIVANNIVLE